MDTREGPYKRGGEMDENDRLMKVSEVAAMFGWADKTVYNKVAKGELPHIKVGGSLRFRASDMRALIEAGASHPAA